MDPYASAGGYSYSMEALVHYSSTHYQGHTNNDQHFFCSIEDAAAGSYQHVYGADQLWVPELMLDSVVLWLYWRLSISHVYSRTDDGHEVFIRRAPIPPPPPHLTPHKTGGFHTYMDIIPDTK